MLTNEFLQNANLRCNALRKIINEPLFNDLIYNLTIIPKNGSKAMYLIILLILLIFPLSKNMKNNENV